MRFFLVTVFTLCSSMLFAQKFWVDVYAGATNYQGDLQDKRYTFNQAHLAGGAGITYDINDHFSARLHLLFGKLSADDKYSRNSPRNLNFASSLFEAQAALQYYLFPLNSRSLNPYAFAGVAVFHFNPYTFDTSGTKYFLKPLSTEGQGFVQGREPYHLTQLSIPFGGGVKLSLTDNLNVGVEIGLRKTFTDYIDDVSTTYVDQSLLLTRRGPAAVELAYRGDELKTGNPYPLGGTIRGGSKYKDLYYFTGVTLSFRLGSGGIGGSGRDGKFSNCPQKL